jgi:hypothetical protein
MSAYDISLSKTSSSAIAEVGATSKQKKDLDIIVIFEGNLYSL